MAKKTGYGNPPEETKWKKGESGNPDGRPKGSLSAKTIIKKWLELEDDWVNPVTKEKVKMTQYDIIALQQIAKARRGDTKAFDSVLDRVEGKPKQEIDVNQDITWEEVRTYVEPENKKKKK
jgi:hypothetical protein